MPDREPPVSFGESNANLPPQSRERELIGVIKEIEEPFMGALQRDYGEKRGWRMCGPASIALSRILSARTGVSIGKDIGGEHIELAVGIFDPQGEPNRLQRIEEQTYIRYHTGDGHVYYIDPIYGLLMQGKKGFREAIQVERYSTHDIDRSLIQKHHLYPFNPNHEGLATTMTFRSLRDAGERQMYYDDSIAALNDERATMSQFIADSGHSMATDWEKTERIIKEFAPEWQENLLGKLERLQELTQAMMGRHRSELTSAGLSTFSMPSRFETIGRGRTEIVYHDQPPTIENWGVGRERQNVLTFHVNGQRFILKEGEALQVYEDGRSKAVTGDHVKAMQSAVLATKDKKTIDFFTTHIKNT